MKQSDTITKLTAALIEAQGEIPSIEKNGENKFHGYKYADLGAYVNIVKPILAKHGLAILEGGVKASSMEEGRMLVELEVKLLHESGEWIETSMFGEGQDVSKTGKIGDKALYKAITGARKYAIASLLNLSTTDDPEKDEHTEDGKQPRRGADMGKAAPIDNAEGVIITDVRKKTGVGKNGKEWTKYTIISGGIEYSTFEVAHANVAKHCKENAILAVIDSQKTQYGYNLLGIAEFITVDEKTGEIIPNFNNPNAPGYIADGDLPF